MESQVIPSRFRRLTGVAVRILRWLGIGIVAESGGGFVFDRVAGLWYTLREFRKVRFHAFCILRRFQGLTEISA